jgi:DNA polymerase-3 subunit alpha
VIHDAVEAIREGRGVDLDIEGIDLDDQDVFKMICEGDTVAIFQLESAGMTQFMKEMQPGGIEDLIAGGALFRPGPMESIPRYIESKRNRNAIHYDDPKLEPILDITYGCIVYQEQVLQIVRDIAGYTYGQADLLRRAVAKKNHPGMENERKNFIYGATDANGVVLVPGAVRNGVPEAVANRIFDDMSDFASYGFNKSHSAAYAFLIYQTAWLKRHYPVEFMAATLNSCMGFTDKVAHYIEQSRKNGIAVLPPDINLSLSKFSVVQGSLRFGLAAVKNIGHGAVEEIIAERRERGAYRSFTDFLRRIGAVSLNKRGIESLIRCGVFDSLNLTRSSLAMSYERLLEGIIQLRRSEMEGQISFLSEGFANIAAGDANNSDADNPRGGIGGAGAGAGAADLAEIDIVYDNSDTRYAKGLDENIPRLQEFSHNLLLNMEKEILGLYVSGHPLDGYMSTIEDLINCDTRAFRQAGTEVESDGGGEAETHGIADGQNAVIGGIISRVKTKFTKSNVLMAFVDLEDMYGSVEMLVFPKIYQRLENKIQTERIVLAKGRISAREDEDAKFICDDIAEIDVSLRMENNNESETKSPAVIDAMSGTPRIPPPILQNGELRKLKQWVASGYNNYERRDGTYGTAYASDDNDYAAPDGHGYETFQGRRGGGNGAVLSENRGSGGPSYGNGEQALYIRVSGEEPKPVLNSAYATLRYFAGRTPVVLYNQARKARKDLGSEYWVKLSDTLLDELRERFGAENVALR